MIIEFINRWCLRVSVRGEARLLAKNVSTCIPIGAVHRLESPGKVPMILSAVQIGGYLGEFDIIHYEGV